MSEHQGLPVAGYTPQSTEAVALANEGKVLEERYLRWLDRLAADPKCDSRMVALARSQMQGAAMWSIRSIFQPKRIDLPEDA